MLESTQLFPLSLLSSDAWHGGEGGAAEGRAEIPWCRLHQCPEWVILVILLILDVGVLKAALGLTEPQEG